MTQSVVIYVLCCLLAFVSVCLIYVSFDIRRMFDNEMVEQDAEHAKCLSMVAAFVGDAFAARVLMAAADALSGMDGQAELARIANTIWVENGPNVPSLWLRERAEAILDKTHEVAS